LRALWLSVLTATGAAVVVMLRRFLLAKREDRSFTAEFGGQRVFGVPDAEDNRVRLLTAELCSRYLTRIPGVRIFHGLSLPDSVFERSEERRVGKEGRSRGAPRRYRDRRQH